MDGEERTSAQPGAAQEHRHIPLPPREGQVGKPNVRNYFKDAQASAVQSRSSLAALQNAKNVSKEAAASRLWKTVARCVGVFVAAGVLGRLLRGSR